MQRLNFKKKRVKSNEPTLAETLSTATTPEEQEMEFAEACFQSQLEFAMKESKDMNPEDAAILAVMEASKAEANAIAAAEMRRKKEENREGQRIKSTDESQPNDVFRELPAIV